MAVQTRAAAYHGIRNMKFAIKKSDGTYEATLHNMLYAQSMSLNSTGETAEQYADDRLILRVPSDNGYEGEIGTVSQDNALEKAGGFMFDGANGTISTDAPAFLRVALYYEFTENTEDGKAHNVKVWLLNTEVGKGSKNHATDKASVEFGSYTYPIHVYGDPMMNEDGDEEFADENGLGRRCFMYTAREGDTGYATFGDAVPVPKAAATV